MGYNKQAGEQLPAAELNSFYASAGLYGASSAGSDTYVITVTPIPNDYDAGDTYTFKADVANTGAATLNVNGLGAKTIKKFSTQDLDTGDIQAAQIVTVKYDGTNFQMESAARPTPFFQQTIPLSSITITPGGASGSNSSGSVFYEVHNQSDLNRYERDSLTGVYILTHSIAMSSFQINSSDYGSIIQIGDYIYVFNPETNITCRRFLAADLTGQTTITVPTVASLNVVLAWTNGTDAYLVSDSTGTTSRRWTLSGTTFSAASTATVASSTFDRVRMCSVWDGTNAYIIEDTATAFNVRRLTNIDGSGTASISKPLYKSTPDEVGSIAASIDATKMYIGRRGSVYTATALSAAVINIIPISKP